MGLNQLNCALCLLSKRKVRSFDGLTLLINKQLLYTYRGKAERVTECITMELAGAFQIPNAL
jgi:hypothetical protein